MAETLQAIVDEVVRCLGDLGESIWSTGEIEGYVQSGYDQLTYDSKCLWYIGFLDDVANQALYNLPADLQRTDRVTWNWRRLPPSKFFELEKIDINFRIIQGQPLTYSIDTDGLKVLRKYPIPAAAGSAYAVTGTWGIARSWATITSDSVTGTWGVSRKTGDQNIGTWGFPRRAFQDETNSRIEYFRRDGYYDGIRHNTFLIPDRYTKIIRFYALNRCYERDGDGQDYVLAKHYLDRYLKAISRIIARSDISKRMREFIMGGASSYRPTVPRPQLPWPYGRQVYP